MNDKRHLTPELFFGFEHNLLLPDEVAEVHAHIAVCPDCRRKLARQADLDGMAGAIHARLTPSPSFFSRSNLGFAALAASLVFASGASLWFVTHRTPDAEETSVAVREAMKTGHIDLPGFLNDLEEKQQTLMGGSATGSGRLLAPRATAVLGPRVTFRWEPQPGASSYRVGVFDLNGAVVTTSPDVAATEWSLETGLQAGRDYQWQVTAIQPTGERTTLPPPSQTPPRFRLADSMAAARLRALADSRKEEHFRLGVEFAQAGLLDDARRELTRAAELEPMRQQIRTMLNELASAPPR
ncbi:MAG: fibronectin type III domain-containing protein [Bryobacterales bacterium]|nr:fibronectin type III domain-containing protein [Bryobacterales bacterium]